MNQESKEEYVNYRFKRANEAFEEALILKENQKWNTVISRLYYACFYAIIALLYKNNIQTKSHEGVRLKFGLHFIKNKKIPKKYGKLFSKLADFRQKGDYGDF